MFVFLPASARSLASRLQLDLAENNDEREQGDYGESLLLSFADGATFKKCCSESFFSQMLNQLRTSQEMPDGLSSVKHYIGIPMFVFYL